MSQDTEHLLKLNAENELGQGSSESGSKKANPGSSDSKPFRSDAIPDVDPARVARAKALLANEAYPCSKVLKSVAQHLASNWVDAPPSSSNSRDVTPRQS